MLRQYYADGVFSNYVIVHTWGENHTGVCEKYPEPLKFYDVFPVFHDALDRVLAGIRRAGHQFFIEWPPAK